MGYKLNPTTKLLYGKYTHSITFNHRHAWFLDGEPGNVTPLINKIKDHFLDDTGVKSLIDILSQLEHIEHRRRSGYASFTIFTSDVDFIDSMKSTYGNIIKKLSEPINEYVKGFLLANPTASVSDYKFVKYKLYVRPLGSADESIAFEEWAKQYTGIYTWSLSYNKSNNRDSIVRVKDENFLMLCRLYLGDKIRKIEEVHTYSEIQDID